MLQIKGKKKLSPKFFFFFSAKKWKRKEKYNLFPPEKHHT